MRETRIIAHQATAGAQTPWQETNPSMPSFTFPLNADPAQVQAAVATLPNSTTPIADLDPESAYWAAVWRNAVSDYQGYLAAFGSSAAPDRTARIQQLVQLLLLPNPQCQASAPPPPPPTIISGPACPDGFYAQGGYIDAYCAPLAPPPVLVCPPGFASVATDDGMACGPFVPPPVLICPPRYRPIGGRFCGPDIPPPYCPPGFRPTWHDGLLVCVRNGPPPPICPFGTHPVWNGFAYVCGGNPPPPPLCPDGRPTWKGGLWSCLRPPPPLCPPGQIQQWINGRMICGGFRPPVGPTPCPPGFVPSRAPGQACIPLRTPGPILTPVPLKPPLPTLTPGRTPTPTPSLTLAPLKPPLPTLTPVVTPKPTPSLTLAPLKPPLPTLTPVITPTPTPTLTRPIRPTPLPGLAPIVTPTPTLTTPIIRTPIVRTPLPTPTPKFTPLIVHTPIVTRPTPLIVRTAAPVVIQKEFRPPPPPQPRRRPPQPKARRIRPVAGPASPSAGNHQPGEPSGSPLNLSVCTPRAPRRHGARSACRLKRIRRLPMKTLIAAFVALATLSVPALAADPQFCANYARDAVHEVNVNMAIPGCFKGFNPRWNRDYGVHYGWCLGASYDAANAEREYRRARLSECRAHAGM